MSRVQLRIYKRTTLDGAARRAGAAGAESRERLPASEHLSTCPMPRGTYETQELNRIPARRSYNPPFDGLESNLMLFRVANTVQNWVFMYVSALIAWWRPGGSTCLSAAAVAVRGRTGSVGACATQPRRSRRGGAGGGSAGRARGDRRGFAKGLFEGTFRRDFQRVSTFTTRLGFSRGILLSVYTRSTQLSTRRS